MATVDFTIGTETFQLACEEGQQARIKMLAKSLDTRFRSLSKTFTSAPNNTVLAITALMMEDEIRGLREKGSSSGNTSLHDDELAKVIDQVISPVADHIEALAQKIETL
mgnify:CR=1 FL=1